MYSNCNTIIYLSAKEPPRFHMKLQIVQPYIYEYIGGPDNEKFSDLKSMKLLWAVDGGGDGVFRHDPVSTNPAFQSTSMKTDISLTIVGKKLFLPEMDLTNEWSITIYNLKGKKVLSEKVKNSIPLDISTLPAGFYLVKINNEVKRNTFQFIIP